MNPTNNKRAIPPDEPTPRPMSDEEVNAVMVRLGSLDGKQISDLCNGYIQQIKSIVSTIKKKMDPIEDEDEIVQLERILRIISLFPAEEIFIRSKDKIWHARFRILNQDAEWFLNRDYSGVIKKDQKQVMIETIIKMAQHVYKELSDEEKEAYWTKAIEMLSIVSKFKKLTGEY